MIQGSFIVDAILELGRVIEYRFDSNSIDKIQIEINDSAALCWKPV